jgi:hypothetical protein
MFVGSRAYFNSTNMASRRLTAEAEHIDRYFINNFLNKTLMNTHQMGYIYTKEDNYNGANLISFMEEEFEISSWRVNKFGNEGENGSDNLVLNLKNEVLKRNFGREKTDNKNEMVEAVVEFWIGVLFGLVLRLRSSVVWCLVYLYLFLPWINLSLNPYRSLEDVLDVSYHS